jgi:hypothetical protein
MNNQIIKANKFILTHATHDVTRALEALKNPPSWKPATTWDRNSADIDNIKESINILANAVQETIDILNNILDSL